MRSRVSQDTRIVATDISCTRETPKAGGSSLLRGREAPHETQVRRDRIGKVGRHRRASQRHRFFRPPTDRQHESMNTPGGAVLTLQLRRQGKIGTTPVATDGKAQRIAARRLVPRGLIDTRPSQNQAILHNGGGIVADEIESQSAIERQRRRIGADALRILVPAQSVDGIAHVEARTGDFRLYRCIARRDLIRAREKAEGRLVVTQRLGRLARVNQGIDVPGVLCETPERDIESLSGTGRSRLDDGTRYRCGFLLVLDLRSGRERSRNRRKKTDSNQRAGP